jgi:3-dehydroquinate synthase
MSSISVSLGERSYPIYIEQGFFRELGHLYRQYGLGKQAVVITDRTVQKRYGAGAREALKEVGLDVQLIPIPPEESSKSLAWADRVYERLIRTEVGREATIVALGGGVVGDLAGFVAATYLRGIPWVQVPTTLVAQIDSAIGGKTGIDHRLGKNLIGAYHQPRFVLVDPELLQSLPLEEVRSGLAEMVKYALIRDPELFKRTEELLPLRTIHELPPMENLIERCCRIKAEIVSQDEREGGLRAILNFGHTVGHALETVTRYQRFRHGEAVAWGMLAAAWLSCERGLLAHEPWERIFRLLSAIELPRDLSGCDDEAMLAAIRRDKKARGGVVRMILLTAIGQASLCEDVTEAELRAVLNHLRSAAASAQQP